MIAINFAPPSPEMIKYISYLLLYSITLCSIIKILWSENNLSSKKVFVALMTRIDKEGNTPLHLCCKNGHTAVVQELLAILRDDGVLEDANR